MNLAGRLALVMCAIAALSTSLALIPQERALPTDLEQAARGRLANSAAAAEQLLRMHLQAFAERYRSISATPEFRANLETDHAPTLQYFTDQLVREQRASLVAFVDRRGRVTSRSGPLDLLRAVLSQSPEEGSERGKAFLVDYDQTPFAAVAVPLQTNRVLVGSLITAEPIGEHTVATWSDLCGAQVTFQQRGAGPGAELTESVLGFGDLDLRVGATLDVERAALANARRDLLTGGALALTLAFAASLVLARGLVRPIRAIQRATEPIGRGEFGTRLESRRRDELGDVSQAFNLMADRLEESQARLLNAQRLARLGNWSMELESRELQVSRQARRLCGLPDGEASLTAALLMERIHPDDRSRFQAALGRCIAEGRPFHLDHRTIDDEGRERFLHTQGESVAVRSGPSRIEGTVQDITDRKMVEEQIRYLANYDSLTGLPNRRLFREHLDLAISEAERSGGKLGLLFLDLDGFKFVNDTFGHTVGDDLLRAVSERLTETALRRTATRKNQRMEAPTVSVSRSGGDEFTFVLTGIDGPQTAGQTARAILEELSKPVELEGQQVTVGASIGIAVFPDDGDSAETLLRNCDAAMYHAKGQGRNGYQFYTESMNTMVFKRLLIESKLRQAIEEEQLKLQFQPKVALADGEVRGFEALVRWRDPELGNVSPAEFIPLAEETGLIGAIGDWVLRAAVRQIKAWEDTELAGLHVAVNLSGYELGESVVARVRDLLEQERVDAELLEFEITETAVIRGEASAIRALEGLREMGLRIALDDFGTGYSSLSYLRNLPIDTLKIDRSFVQFVETDDEAAALLGAIVSMAKVLNLQVVAEGVEAEGQLALLSEIGCDEVQGNLLGAPANPGDLGRIAREIDRELWRKRQAAESATRSKKTRSRRPNPQSSRARRSR